MMMLMMMMMMMMMTSWKGFGRKQPLTNGGTARRLPGE
jgi:hypothetical protein